MKEYTGWTNRPNAEHLPGSCGSLEHRRDDHYRLTTLLTQPGAHTCGDTEVIMGPDRLFTGPIRTKGNFMPTSYKYFN